MATNTTCSTIQPIWLANKSLNTEQKLANAKAAYDYAMSNNMAAVSMTSDGQVVTRDFKAQREYIDYLEALYFREDRCSNNGGIILVPVIT